MIGLLGDKENFRERFIPDILFDYTILYEPTLYSGMLFSHRLNSKSSCAVLVMLAFIKY